VLSGFKLQLSSALLSKPALIVSLRKTTIERLQVNRTSKIALYAAIIGPIQSALGWIIAGSMWPGYDQAKQTISELASPESPVKEIMSSFFVFGGLLTVIVAIYAKSLAMPARVAMFISAICTFGLTIFPTPLIGYSTTHRVFAIASFAISAGWPLLALRRSKTAAFAVRPVPTIVGTALQAGLAIWFLVTWTDPAAVNIGLWERVVAVSQAAYVTWVIVSIYLNDRKTKSTAL
jgi:hypothetical membrane protein